MQSNNHKGEDKRKAMSLVNKLYELAELPVSFRQNINDKADEIVIEHVRSERESAVNDFGLAFKDRFFKYPPTHLISVGEVLETINSLLPKDN